MRIGLSVKEIGRILNVNPSRVSQSIDPALTKVAKLFRAYPVETLEMILHAAGRADRETVHPAKR